MKKVILILLAIAFPGLLCAKNNKSTDALLREIDGLIKNRRTYGVEKEARIADLKRLLAEATSDEQRYGFCGRLFDEYRAYNLDSSFVYAQRKEELAHRMDKLDYLDDAAMNMAEVMGTTGMYKEALELLGQIDKKTLPDYLYGYYYHLYRTIYGLMGDYAVTEKVKKEYYRMTDLYRDSLLQVNASDSLGHVLVMADKCIVHAQYDEAIRMLMEYYNKPSLDDHSKAMLTYTLSEGYRLKGDKQGFVGYEKIAKDYGHTDAGNLANFYAGICYAQQGKDKEAIPYLEAFDTQDDVTISPAALNTLANCYASTNQLDKAVATFKEAAKLSGHNSLAPICLKEAAQILESQNKKAEALALYQQIKNEYGTSITAQDIDKYIERVSK